MNAVLGLWILLLTPGVPLLLAAALLVKRDSPRLIALAAWGALPALVTSALMPPGIAATVPWVLEGSEFGLDSTGRVFLFFSSAVWLVGGFVARAWISSRQGPFFRFFLLAMSGSLGLIIARDLVAFYLFFSLMSFAAYGLVNHERNQRARHAGRIYMIFVLAGDMAIFAALVLIAQETGGELSFEVASSVLPTASHGGPAVALLLLGLGVKTGLLGVHVTLPLIYAAAPNPAGVVLAGAMVNAGLLGWLRLLPIGLGTMPGWGRGLMAAGAAAALYGALAGVLQRRPATVLAYSSISQMGIVALTVGAGLTVDDGGGFAVGAATLYALHHAFAKSVLFLGAGLTERTGRIGPRALWVGLLLAALTLAGAPFTTGMLAKETVKEALSAAPGMWGSLSQGALPWLAFATTIVLARFLWLVRPGARQRAGSVGGVPTLAWLALVLLTLCAAWLVPDLHRPELWTARVLWELTWPVLLGALASAAAVMAARRFRWQVPVLPAGDVLVGYSAVAGVALRVWRLVSERNLPALRGRLLGAVGDLTGHPRWSAAAGHLERRLVEWRVSALVLVVVILALWLLTIWR